MKDFKANRSRKFSEIFVCHTSSLRYLCRPSLLRKRKILLGLKDFFFEFIRVFFGGGGIFLSGRG